MPAPAVVSSGDRPGPVPAKPRMRGVLHQIAFFVSLAAGASLVASAPTAGSAAVLLVYAVSLSLLFGVSALFHRRTWGPIGRRRMRRADHATIFVAIAGTYTAVAGIALTGWARVATLGIVWGGAVAGIAMRQLWLDAPKWAVALPYVVVGWVALAVLPELLHALGATGFTLLLAGGLCYSVGAVVYARKRPDPWPEVFGYHEVFHACTVVGAILHYIAIAWFVVPLAG